MGTKASAERMRLAYQAEPKLCKQCTNPIEFDKKVNTFCSKSCSATHNNVKAHWRYTDNAKATYATINCVTCKRECKKTHKSQLYCSFACSSEADRIKRHEDFHLGMCSSYRAKLVLIELHGHVCMECGWDKINVTHGKCPVELEHVDGNSTNNHPSNLKLMCPNCHSLTPTYRALNKGNGRENRRLRSAKT